jgi:Family of unknown function (DUF6069)
MAMTAGYGGSGGVPEARPGVDAGRLWAGGIATAVVAALTAIVGLLIARGIFHATVLEPKGGGIWGNASTVTYALVAALVALLATGLMHLLCLAVPAPSTFFGWIMVLVTAIGVVIPLTLNVATSTKAATAAINLVIGLVITMIISSMAASARTVHLRKRTTVTQARTEQYERPPTTRYDV